ncbi:hypothetical protein [Hymenobacter sp.]|uniref:hypothetical protein n=1 Tax=Hymenobacter sp. TaxID=1898978 RepID=UPI00286C0C48|nr:hypothetical protein [Hymenobacter sp.]
MLQLYPLLLAALLGLAVPRRAAAYAVLTHQANLVLARVCDATVGVSSLGSS